MRKIIITCFLAGCLEMYDFTIFGFLAVILKQHYLNFLSEKNSSILIYSLFAVGFIFRPVGSVIFGYLGDKFGRKKALISSLFLMSISCLGMAILPTYQSVGIISCYLMIFLRILQGISVGGEYSGCLVFAVEHASEQRRGFVGSIITSGCMCGILLAVLISNLLTIKSLPEYSWRLAFLLGVFLSFIGHFIRKHLDETPIYRTIDSQNYKNFLWSNIKYLRLEIMVSILIVANSSTNFYFTAIYLPHYLKKYMQSNCSYLSTQTTLLMAIFVPLFGYIADRVGKRKLMSLAALLLVLYISNLNSILHLNSKYITDLSIIHVLITAAFTAPMNSLIIEIFPKEIRYTCSAMCFGIGIAIGGMAPMLAEIFDRSQNSSLYISIYIFIMSLFSFLGVRSLNRVNKTIF